MMIFFLEWLAFFSSSGAWEPLCHVPLEALALVRLLVASVQNSWSIVSRSGLFTVFKLNTYRIWLSIWGMRCVSQCPLPSRSTAKPNPASRVLCCLPFLGMNVWKQQQCSRIIVGSYWDFPKLLKGQTKKHLTAFQIPCYLISHPSSPLCLFLKNVSCKEH